MRQRRAIGPIELPGAAELALADLGPASPERGRGLVVEGDAALGVGRIDGGRQGLEQLRAMSAGKAASGSGAPLASAVRRWPREPRAGMSTRKRTTRPRQCRLEGQPGAQPFAGGAHEAQPVPPSVAGSKFSGRPTPSSITAMPIAPLNSRAHATKIFPSTPVGMRVLDGVGDGLADDDENQRGHVGRHCQRAGGVWDVEMAAVGERGGDFGAGVAHRCTEIDLRAGRELRSVPRRGAWPCCHSWSAAAGLVLADV